MREQYFYLFVCGALLLCGVSCSEQPGGPQVYETGSAQPESVRGFGVAVAESETLGVPCYEVPPSVFLMGDPHAASMNKLTLFTMESYSTGAGPVRRTEITKGYVISDLVTTDEYLEFVRDQPEERWDDLVIDSELGNFENGEAVGDGSEPVDEVTYYGALEFCKWLGAKHGLAVRLPTEAEWELWQTYYRKSEGTARNEITGAWCADYFGDELSPIDNVDPLGPVRSSVTSQSSVQTRVVRRLNINLKPRYPGLERGQGRDAAIYGLQFVVEVDGEQDHIDD
jgi:hypothetical protein